MTELGTQGRDQSGADIGLDLQNFWIEQTYLCAVA